MFTFYLIIGFENALCLFLYFAFPGNGINSRYDWFPTTASSLIIVGTIIGKIFLFYCSNNVTYVKLSFTPSLGHASQLLYYRWFHPSGPIGISSCTSAVDSLKLDAECSTIYAGFFLVQLYRVANQEPHISVLESNCRNSLIENSNLSRSPNDAG